MTDESAPARSHAPWVMFSYALICALALGFDLLTDRSFGALMLAVLPISLIALVRLVAGPWLEPARMFSAMRDWFVGASGVLVITIAFSLLGADQAKTGELIFTYALMIMAFPSSLVLPFVTPWLEPLLGGSVVIRIVGAWIVCVAAGWLEWQLLRWLYANIQQRARPKAMS